MSPRMKVVSLDGPRMNCSWVTGKVIVIYLYCMRLYEFDFLELLEHSPFWMLPLL